MIVAFFESVKYTGHLVPIAFLRIYLGYYFLPMAGLKFQGNYLNQPQLAGMINEWLKHSGFPLWYQSFMEAVVVPYWQVFAYLATISELAIGIGFVIGFLVRPLSVLAAFISFNFILAGTADIFTVHKVLFALCLTLGWVGAGRCLGFDYFFFKRNRGIWW